MHIRGGGCGRDFRVFWKLAFFWLALVGHRSFSFLSRDKVNIALALLGGPGLNLLKGYGPRTRSLRFALASHQHEPSSKKITCELGG